MEWHLHLDVVLWLGALLAAYYAGLRLAGAPRGLRASRGQVAWFGAGVAALYVGAGTPIHDLAEERLFSVHMVQHTLFTLVAPPMLLAGTPHWLIDPLLRHRLVYLLLRTGTRPVVAFLLINLTLLFTHLPFAVNAALRYHTLHFVIHLVLVGMSLLMWWPVYSPSKLLPRLAPPLQMIFLFVQSFIPGVLASFITFASTPWYQVYIDAPRMWGMSAVDDQRIAGLIMKLAGPAILWLVIAVVFFRWVSDEERREQEDAALRWEDVEQELARMGLTRPGAPQST